MPELYHPDLDVTIVVDDSRARNRRAAGWVDLADGGTVESGPHIVGDDPEPETFPEPSDADDTVEDDD